MKTRQAIKILFGPIPKNRYTIAQRDLAWKVYCAAPRGKKRQYWPCKWWLVPSRAALSRSAGEMFLDSLHELARLERFIHVVENFR